MVHALVFCLVCTRPMNTQQIEMLISPAQMYSGSAVREIMLWQNRANRAQQAQVDAGYMRQIAWWHRRAQLAMASAQQTRIQARYWMWRVSMAFYAAVGLMIGMLSVILWLLFDRQSEEV